MSDVGRSAGYRAVGRMQIWAAAAVGVAAAAVVVAWAVTRTTCRVQTACALLVLQAFALQRDCEASIVSRMAVALCVRALSGLQSCDTVLRRGTTKRVQLLFGVVYGLVVRF